MGDGTQNVELLKDKVRNTEIREKKERINNVSIHLSRHGHDI